MKVISTEHFCDNMQMMSHEKISKKLAMLTYNCINAGKQAELELNGSNYYLALINPSSYGFGSGRLEIEFTKNDSEKIIEDKYLKFFDLGFSDIVGYGGFARVKAFEHKPNWVAE